MKESMEQQERAQERKLNVKASGEWKAQSGEARTGEGERGGSARGAESEAQYLSSRGRPPRAPCRPSPGL